ncbi:hypothetical protein [Nocardia sp. NPDC059228]|uniref:hypothetical protein n=1 Tax=Nocardia sp. NPDC059228 TaxID=3346777 RepID=UPI0036B2F114
MVDGVLLDTNFLSLWHSGSCEAPEPGAYYASTTTLQELYSMQAPQGWGYRYLLPSLARDHLWGLPDVNHLVELYRGRILKGQAGMARTDKLLINFPASLAGHGFAAYLEKSHQAVANVQNARAFGLIEGMASVAIDRNIGRIVGVRARFLSDVEVAPLPLTMSEITIAVDLLQEVLRARINLKQHRRNSFNDLLILATALRWGLRLKTGDRLLLELALRAGMIQTDDASGVASLIPPAATAGTPPSYESKRYINSRWRARRPAGRPRS